MHYIGLIFSGMLLCNCLPHLASGLQGQPFPTPFAKPRGVGDSSPLVNFVWGFGNLVVGLALLAHHPVTIGLNADWIAVLAGAAAIGLHLALHFGKVRRERD
ncbi:hypothetical protein CY652_00945 [Burkholderia sp. WAC0059]|uniref:hypothetical protein n=1 Tax=Burkholderia sp. WAC0059 TaxID=2066022 RepID=UPI000C7EACA2|nr:hypothetical protein [Burkholderia sp. WAC0059]PLZ04274.1 hypothetical protein CY652_00945 [Burkholderia sp. WAC0059]